MPPRRRTHVRGATNQRALDAKSDRASSPMPRRRGHGRTRSRSRGKAARQVEEPAPGRAILEVVTEICEVH